MAALATPQVERVEHFPCFGGSCTVVVEGGSLAGTATQAAASAKRRLLAWHDQFTRFERTSELSRLNDDPRETVPVSAMMARFIAAARHAAELTGGLVDPTLVDAVERAGYTEDLRAGHHGPAPDLGPGATIRPAAPDPRARWREVVVDREAGQVTRPPGVRLDSGGIVKGLFGDVLAETLCWHASFVVAAAGDARFGGVGGTRRAIEVENPFRPGEILHTFELVSGAVATSGTTKRRWLDASGRLAHHLLDPATGAPAFTGVVQATALAPTGVEAEALAKAALLAGPDRAPHWLRHGGVIVLADGTHRVLAPDHHLNRKAVA